jgi:hypothetical protein
LPTTANPSNSRVLLEVEPTSASLARQLNHSTELLNCSVRAMLSTWVGYLWRCLDHRDEVPTCGRP